jgi:hypothetical protein
VGSRATREQWALFALAVGFAVFHHLPALAGEEAGDWIDLVTPFAVAAAAAVTLALLGGGAWPIALAVVAGVLYVDGHGIHLAANSIGHEELSGEAEDVTHFWDEPFSHHEWHLGWILLLAAVCLAESRSGRATGRPRSLALATATALLLGFTLFTSTVEGGTWWLALAGAVLFAVWAWKDPRPLLLTCAGGLVLAAILIGAYAIWQGGVPQFTDAGLF